MKTTTLYILTLVLFGINFSNQSIGDYFDKILVKKGIQLQILQSANSTSTIAKTSEMLNEDKFWSIIEESKRHTNNQVDQEAFLVKEIEKLKASEMIGFRLRTDKLLFDTYNSNIWCAGYIMNGGCSDDGFEYFRCWIISRGKATYEKAKINPDYLINEVVKNADLYDFENFWYVALTAFKNKTGKDLYDFIDYDKFTTHEGKYPQFELTWDDQKPESMKKICPNLFEKLWKL